MDTLTRVMSRYVYNINLHDLPLERQMDKNKRRIRSRGLSHELKTDSSRANIEEKVTNDSNEVKPMKRIRSSSGDSPTHMGKSVSRQASHQCVTRSRSDSHLFEDKPRKFQNRRTYRMESNPENRIDLSVKCRSLECFDIRNESPIWSENSVSRSPSPTHSNVIENNSLKDSPMNLESGPDANSGLDSAKSVLIGGTYRGWSPESAFILWQRMLGILGDVNKLSNPSIHAQAMECLVKIVEDFIKVKENLGLSDSPTTPNKYLEPPLHYLSSWLFKAAQLPNEFKAGKLLALKLLCITTVRRNEIEPSKEFLSLFYLTLRQGLMSYDMVFNRNIHRIDSNN